MWGSEPIIVSETIVKRKVIIIVTVPKVPPSLVISTVATVFSEHSLFYKYTVQECFNHTHIIVLMPLIPE